eukprot:scaffold4437_cov115-Isochrysis_galbana.AAC.3
MRSHGVKESRRRDGGGRGGGEVNSGGTSWGWGWDHERSDGPMSCRQLGPYEYVSFAAVIISEKTATHTRPHRDND